MKRVAWTKFQDFYLRLGFLKALASIMSLERRSVPNDAIIHRLQSPSVRARDGLLVLSAMDECRRIIPESAA